MNHQARRALGTAALLVLACGCRNPFNPSADIAIKYISPVETRIDNADVPTPNYWNWRITCYFDMRNKVAVTLKSVNIVYTDSLGNYVTVYDTTGRNFNFHVWLQPLEWPDDSGGSFYQTAVPLFLVDAAVLQTISSPAYPTDRIMFADITFRGEDDNGYDVKLTAKVTIKGYGLN